jgi:hypothetical protein
MNTFATTQTSASRQALRSSARKLGTARGSIGAFVVLAIVAAAAASAGAFGTFTSTVDQTHSVTAGTVVIALGATGAQTNRLDVDATNVAPGDTIERTVDLSNTGSLDLASIDLTTTASPSSALDTDTTNGLQMVIQNCDQAWTEAGSSPAYTYTCGGSTTSVFASAPVITSNTALNNLTALTSGDTDHLLLTLTLPSSADNTFQGDTSTIDYSFTATQRTATNR